MLKIKVFRIKGRCPVYKKDRVFYIKDGYILKTNTKLCMHSLCSIIPYYIALSKGVKPKNLSLGNKNKTYVQCLDPCEITNGGTVIFEIES